MSASAEICDNGISVPVVEEPIKKSDHSEMKPVDVVENGDVDFKEKPVADEAACGGSQTAKDGAVKNTKVDDQKLDANAPSELSDGKSASNQANLDKESSSNLTKTEKVDGSPQVDEPFPSKISESEKTTEKSASNMTEAEKAAENSKLPSKTSDSDALIEKSNAAEKSGCDVAVTKPSNVEESAKIQKADGKEKHTAAAVVADKTSDSMKKSAVTNVSETEKTSMKEKSVATNASCDEKSGSVKKSDVAAVNEETTKVAADMSDTKGKEEVFTDAMIEKIEKNYDPTDVDAVNLLETPDDEMFPVNESKPAKTSGTESVAEVNAVDSVTKMNGANSVAKTNGDTTAKPELEKDSEISEASEAVNLLLQGKRNMLVKDYESAVSTLGDACQKFASLYGDLGEECAEVYMVYGQALLELWRVEDANKKNNEEADETKDLDMAEDSVREEDGVAKENGVGEKEKSANGVAEVDKKGEGDAAEDERMEVDDVEKNDSEAVANQGADENEEDRAENDDEEEEEVESDEDVDNLQVAWEILELAKKIYEMTKDNVNLAKVHSKLGEISIASGNFVYAVDDLKCSLELLEKSSVPADIRHKANIHFQLYIAHSMKCSFPEAEAELRVAKSLFESHLRDLEKKRLESATEESEVGTLDAEIKEIKDVIRDLNSKMAESHKEKRELISAISDVIKTKHPVSEVMPPSSAPLSAAVSPGPSSSSTSVDEASSKFSPLKSNVPVNNISHLVRKKPKVVAIDEAKPVEKSSPTVVDEVKKTAESKLNDNTLQNGSETTSSVKENSVKSESGGGATASAPDESISSAGAASSQESAIKRKADDDLEKSDAKKFCA